MFALLYSVLLTLGWEGGEWRTHSVLGKQASLVLLCVSVPARWASGGWLASSPAHRPLS